jgi:Lamin Tail Domain/CHU_C Type IX secretion signal domain/Bacterial Ig-like domain
MKTLILITAMLLFHAFGHAQVAARYNLVINELMADPGPQVGLPNNEWIEIRNVSATAFNLAGWRIGDAGGQSGPMPSFTLLPDSFVIVCTSGAVALMSAFGPAIAVTGFPSLDNTGDVIFLKSPQNRIIHAVSYSDAWYGNELKKEGGWSLEMIDPKNPCSGSGNWTASVSIHGGTPGKINSVNASNTDTDAPGVLRAFAIDSVNISLVFDEPLDSLKASIAAHYSISDGIGTAQSVTVLQPVFDRVILKLANPLARNKIYSITVTGITDCVSNLIGPNNKVRVGLAENADRMDIVLNEILFNPASNGTDYVEIYNRSGKVIDLKQLHIANRSSSGAISNIKQLSADNYLLFPGDFMVITEDPAIVKRDFITLNMDAFTKLASMPSFNDDMGDVLILNAQGKIVDELQYDEKWHFKLIDNREGVALERVDQNAPTQNAANWHSAAGSVGYGTPTYKNSQYRLDQQTQGFLTVAPAVISPDNDGRDDFLTIEYDLPSPGYVANITVFDAAGRTVRYLQRNALCGIKGNFRWDGLGEKDQRLPTGIYIIHSALFNLDGKKKQFKNVVVVAR